MKKYFIIACGCALIFNSCSTHKIARSSRLKPKKLKPNSYYIVPLDATIKENMIWTDSNGNFHILSEVSPDAVITAVNNITTTLTGKLAKGDSFSASQITQITQSVTELGKRTVAVSILRDALYRLEEYNMNDSLRKRLADTNGATFKLFMKILNVADTIAQTEIQAEKTKTQIAASQVADATAKVAQITKETESIKLQQLSISPDLNSKYQLASDFEEKGFNSLLNNNIDDAIEAFQNAENIYPTFHSVYEIGKLLKEKREDLKAAKKSVNDIYKTILDKYSWGMPDDVKKKMENIIKSK